MPSKKVKTIGEEEPICNICCSNFNKSTRKEITCNYCPDKACMECIKRYLLDTTGEYHCMFCRNKWSRDVLVEKLPQKFINDDLRTSLENHIVDIEKARLPIAQEIAEDRVRKSNYIKFIEAINTIKSQYENNDAQKDLIALIAKNYGIGEGSYDTVEQTEPPKNIKQIYTRQCPNSECRGFINSEWNCGLCGTTMCKECYEKTDTSKKHTCDPDSLKTKNLIEKDSKPCPKCQTLIFRISGCDQMYCVMCHTGFSWRLGSIVKGPIHNPHYFQWLQTKNNNDLQQQSGCNENTFPAFQYVISSKNAKTNNYCKEWLAKFYQYFVHIFNVNRNSLNREGTDDKMEANVNYLLAKISKTEWKKQLYQIDKKQQISRDVIEVIDMAYSIAGERFRAFTSDSDVQHIKDLEALIKYVVEQTEIIRKRYATKNILISKPEWYI